ncbi:MAG: VC2046/SO_2500 family protein [Succinivibrio sp.]
MLEGKLRDVMLVDELQLGSSLNHAVNSGSRAEFSLLLAMLSEDVCDAPQFSDPIKTPARKEDLRARFGLPPKQPCYAAPGDFERAGELSEALGGGGRAALSLLLCARQEPLCDRERQLSPDVYSSLSPLEREKFELMKDSKAPSRLPMQKGGDGSGMVGETEQSRAMLGKDDGAKAQGESGKDKAAEAA